MKRIKERITQVQKLGDGRHWKIWNGIKSALLRNIHYGDSGKQNYKDVIKYQQNDVQHLEDTKTFIPPFEKSPIYNFLKTYPEKTLHLKQKVLNIINMNKDQDVAAEICKIDFLYL